MRIAQEGAAAQQVVWRIHHVYHLNLLVAYMITKTEGDNLHVLYICVNPKYRRCNIGSNLLRRATLHWRQRFAQGPIVAYAQIPSGFVEHVGNHLFFLYRNGFHVDPEPEIVNLDIDEGRSLQNLIQDMYLFRYDTPFAISVRQLQNYRTTPQGNLQTPFQFHYPLQMPVVVRGRWCRRRWWSRWKWHRRRWSRGT